MSKNECPVCNEAECFACENGLCVVLKDNDFKGKKCPFFKTNEQAEKEQAYCEERISKIRKKLYL